MSPELERLRQKIIEIIKKNPQKAGAILSSWIRKAAQKKKKPA